MGHYNNMTYLIWDVPNVWLSVMVANLHIYAYLLSYHNIFLSRSQWKSKGGLFFGSRSSFTYFMLIFQPDLNKIYIIVIVDHENILFEIWLICILYDNVSSRPQYIIVIVDHDNPPGTLAMPAGRGRLLRSIHRPRKIWIHRTQSQKPFFWIFFKLKNVLIN